MASLPHGNRPGSAHASTATPMVSLAHSPHHARRPTLPDRYAPAVNEDALEFAPASYAASSSGSDSPPPRPLSPLLSPSKAAVFLLRPHLLAARIRRQPLVFLVAGLVLFSLVLLAANRGRPGAMAMPSTDDAIPGLSWGSSSGSIKDDTAAAPPPDEDCRPAPGSEATIDACATTRLPNIPPKIWQVYLDFQPRILAEGFIPTWLARAPSHAYVLLDAAGATSVVQRLAHLASAAQAPRVPVYWAPEAKAKAEAKAETKTEAEATEAHLPEDVPLSFARDALALYEAMPRRVLRADFLRYLVLALEGGVYSDFDTALERPLRDWVPAGLRAQTRLIVGLEADQMPPVKGTTYPVQFCQWTLASAAGHATMWTMVERILAHARARPQGASAAATTKEMTDTDVLQETGPAAWTEVVYEHLNRVAGDGVGQPRITWHTLTGLREPRLFGDTLVLPIDGFATGVPHSHASRQRTEQTLVRHHFRGDWRNNNG